MATNTIEIAAGELDYDSIYGRGINCFSGLVANPTCTIGAAKGPAQRRDIDNKVANVVSSSSTFSNFMSSSTTVSASGLSWSASASVSFLRDATGSDMAISYAVFRDKRTVDYYVDRDKVTISKDALDLLARSGIDAFIETYGTHCVIGVSYGGSFGGYVKIEASSTSVKSTLSASLKASMNDFGMGGSINSEFTQALSNTSATYTRTANTRMVGANPSNSTNDQTTPDGMLATAQNLTFTMDGTNEIGVPVAVICATWDYFHDIRDALAKLNNPNGLSFIDRWDRVQQLSDEYTRLNYMANTCDTLLKQNQFALPAHADLAGRIRDTASSAQTNITTLRMSSIPNLTLANYMLSGGMSPHVAAMANRSVMVLASWYTDAAFDNSGNHSSTFTTPFPNNDETFVVKVHHHNVESDANLAFHVGHDDQGYYLTTHWNEFNSGRTDIGAPTFPQVPWTSRASWTGAAWNSITATMLNYP